MIRRRPGRVGRLARTVATSCAAVCAAATIAPVAHAQQTTITPAATQPGRGVLVQRSLFTVEQWDVDPARDGFTDVREFRADLSFAYGLSGDWSVLANVPVVHRDFDGLTTGASSDPTGVGDPRIEVRHRFVNEPLGPVDTLRVTWFAGVELPVGRSDFSSDSFDPYAGLALTSIVGRLGLGAGVSYAVHTGATDTPLRPGNTTADHLRVTGSAAWRLSPAQWGADLEAATYLTLEAEFDLETSGERRARLAPGFLVEAPTYAIEIAGLLPVFEEADRRPESDWGLIVGVRVFF